MLNLFANVKYKPACSLIQIIRQTTEQSDKIVCVWSSVFGADQEMSAMFTWSDPHSSRLCQGLSLSVSLFVSASASLSLIWLSELVDPT